MALQRRIRVTDKPITNKIDGELFEKLVTGGASNLKANIKTVNDLNVFPIPDGDTGDNMYMTMSGGISALKAVSENSVYRKAKALADGMLLNARGNSGVILSQLFYGLANGFKDEDIATVKDFGNALKSGVKQAYASVVKPVEGTMLTVAREAADFAIEHSTDEDTLDKFFKIFIDEMQKSLERTPELLEVLKEAGVIDSGGAGLLYITEGMKDALDGKKITDLGELSVNKKEVDFSKFTADSVMTFGYCTECLLQLQNSKVDAENFDEKTITVEKSVLSGGEVTSANDHRIAMSAAIASLMCRGEVKINMAEAVEKSYPDFYEKFRMLGGKCR